MTCDCLAESVLSSAPITGVFATIKQIKRKKKREETLRRRHGASVDVRCQTAALRLDACTSMPDLCSEGMLTSETASPFGRQLLERTRPHLDEPTRAPPRAARRQKARPTAVENRKFEASRPLESAHTKTCSSTSTLAARTPPRRIEDRAPARRTLNHARSSTQPVLAVNQPRPRHVHARR